MATLPLDWIVEVELHAGDRPPSNRLSTFSVVKCVLAVNFLLGNEALGEKEPFPFQFQTPILG